MGYTELLPELLSAFFQGPLESVGVLSGMGDAICTCMQAGKRSNLEGKAMVHCKLRQFRPLAACTCAYYGYVPTDVQYVQRYTDRGAT